MKSIIEIQADKSIAETLNDFSIDAIIAINCNYIIIAWNDAAETIYKASKKEALGKSIFDVIPRLKEDNESANAINKAIKGIKSFVPANNLYKHRQHSENHYIPLKNNTGDITGVMNIVHDVAHRIKAEKQLQHLNDELEKRYRQLQITSEEMASFTYITSNKIKEPIRLIYTGVEHLIKVEASRLTDSGKATFRRIQSSLNRMDLLLDDVLSLAQISILQKPDSAVDLNRLVKEVSTEIVQKSDKKVIINTGALRIIKGHKTYLHVLFYNLLINAVKFNEADIAKIEISCEKLTLDVKVNGMLAANEYYRVNISDNGIGFRQEDAEKIFTMFEKLNPPGKYKGSGIGLTIAKKIMEAHDGFITAEGVPCKGSVFHCFFPVDDDA